jgi:hypothetical protein
MSRHGQQLIQDLEILSDKPQLLTDGCSHLVVLDLALLRNDQKRHPGFLAVCSGFGQDLPKRVEDLINQ